MIRYLRRACSCLAVLFVVSTGTPLLQAQIFNPTEFPPHTEVMKGYTPVITQANITPMFGLYRNKDGHVYAELPPKFVGKRYFIATTTSSGETYAGLQGNDIYVYWRQYGKRLALIQPEIGMRAEGDSAASSSVKRLFTDQVLVDVPVLTIGPRKGAVIDLDALLIGNASRFFGSRAAPNAMQIRNGIFKLAVAKAFKNNIEVSFEVPTSGGILKKLHYSISEIPNSTGYKPRPADQRVGYFTTTYSDLAKYNDRETRVRFINRWHLEKADPRLKLSPPKKAIEFYIEHTTPIRYRRWVREGILSWNKAFENIGISDAIEVHYQDANPATMAHMDKDPEDVNYNFVRWLNNNIGTAIGPSRVHPLTGQILDADIILTDGWIRHYKNQFSEIMPRIAMQGFGPKTLAWLAENPNWDPRVRLADPSQRAAIQEKIAADAMLPFSGHPLANADPFSIGDEEYDGLHGRTSQVNGFCSAADGMAFDVAMMRMSAAMLNAADADGKEGEGKKEEPKTPAEQMLDGMPESFVGPLIAHLVAHEVGHTLGLRHNFKSSSAYTYADINSGKLKGSKPHAGSVMDYIGANFRMAGGDQQGDYTMIGIGPYDMWAIEYGYTFASDLKPILARCAEPELTFGTDEDTFGPDPLARRYDFSKDPLDFAKNQMELVKYHRKRLLTDFIKDGDSWDRIRYGYELTLSLQTRASSMMSNWVGGAFIHRHKKGDPKSRKPVEVVPAAQQRAALQFVIANTLNDEAFGLNSDLTTAMGLDKWSDDRDAAMSDATWPIHERIMGIQASTLTQLMNPTTLGRCYDNEFRVPADQETLTLPELLSTVTSSVWSELEAKVDGARTARKPQVSSMRRNLQREHLQRLIDLALADKSSSPAGRAISALATQELQTLVAKIEACVAATGENADPYSRAHFAQATKRIRKVLNAGYLIQ